MSTFGPQTYIGENWALFAAEFFYGAHMNIAIGSNQFQNISRTGSVEKFRENQFR